MYKMSISINVIKISCQTTCFVEVTCENLPPVGLNMLIRVTSSDFGSPLTYKCEEGFILTNTSINMTCQQDGQWSKPDVTPDCQGR